MDFYISFVKGYPVISAVIQFAILGTFGEVISRWIPARRIFSPFPMRLLLWKALIWSVLAVCIKYAFVGFNGFIDALIINGYLPSADSLFRAFAISAAMNLQFGPFLVLFHRLLDNLYPRQSNWSKIDKGLMSLLWFWIPAHTITFILPKEYQIGLAAVWSVALGIILGYFSRTEDKSGKIVSRSLVEKDLV
jgi:hypothetical protein